MPVHCSVSVVIPTRGRADRVVHAVRSALRQSSPPLEVIVVIDGADPETHRALTALDDPSLIVVQLESGRGAGAARNAGIERARGQFVAFLDDDDEWHPDKLASQIPTHLEAEDPDRTVSATAARWHVGSGKTVVWPLRSPRRNESIPDYLFVRMRAGEGVLATPTLLVPTDLARRIPMPTTLRTHEEWDWLVSMHAAGVAVVVNLTPLAEISAEPRRRSLSAQEQDWRYSLAWARSRREDLGSRAYSAFILTEVGRAAALSRAGARSHLSIAVASAEGAPRLKDVARHLARPLVFRLTRRSA